MAFTFGTDSPSSCFWRFKTSSNSPLIQAFSSHPCSPSSIGQAASWNILAKSPLWLETDLNVSVHGTARPEAHSNVFIIVISFHVISYLVFILPKRQCRKSLFFIQLKMCFHFEITYGMGGIVTTGRPGWNSKALAGLHYLAEAATHWSSLYRPFGPQRWHRGGWMDWFCNLMAWSRVNGSSKQVDLRVEVWIVDDSMMIQ